MPAHEIGSAFLSSFAVAPAMMVIDTAVIKSQFQNKSFTASLRDSLQDYRTGITSWKVPFRTMFGVYASTYATANLTEFACRSAGVDYKIPTMIMTSMVNIAAIAYKDKEYAKLFGSTTSRQFPRLSYGLFAIRDTITITSSFVVKKDFIAYLERNFHIEHRIADFFASLTLPMAAQLISTPIHILSIDLFMSPHDTIQHRIKNILSKYPSVCTGRMFRVIPAFGIGGFINDMIRPRRDYDK